MAASSSGAAKGTTRKPIVETRNNSVAASFGESLDSPDGPGLYVKKGLSARKASFFTLLLSFLIFEY